MQKGSRVVGSKEGLEVDARVVEVVGQWISFRMSGRF